MSDFGALGVRVFLSIIVIATLGFGLTGVLLVRMESNRHKAEEAKLVELVDALQARTGVNITLAPEIKSTAVLGKVSNVELIFKPQDIIAAMQTYRDSLPKQLIIQQR